MMTTKNTNETKTAQAPSFPEIIEINKKTSIDFDSLHYAASAVSTSPRREVLQNICIHEGQAIGTNGRVLNMGKLSDAFPKTDEKVLYRIVKRTKTILIFQRSNDGMVYPEYTQVLPKRETKLGDFDASQGHSFEFCKILHASDGAGFDYDLFKLMAPLEVCATYQESSGAPLCMVTKNKKFLGILMPLRMGKN